MTATVAAPVTHGLDKISWGRQELILDPEVAEAAHVTIFGCGTVGSNAAIECARLGIPNMQLFDFDNVEPHNLPSQRFDRTHLGTNKAASVKAQLVHLTNNDGKTIVVQEKKVEGPVPARGIAILAVDTMQSRREIWEKVLRPQYSVDLMLDFRMSGNLLQCYAADPRDERYEATLFDDKDADPAPCGGRTVSYTGALAGCIAANYARKHLAGADVPFFTGMDLDAMELHAPNGS